jgi:hypothetical protein
MMAFREMYDETWRRDILVQSEDEEQTGSQYTGQPGVMP